MPSLEKITTAPHLTFDALGFPRHLANFLTLLKRSPKLRTVIDHCMKPQIRDHSAAHRAAFREFLVAAVLTAPGLIWATGLGRPPFVATCSLWKSSQAAATYAYGPNDAAHQTAIRADRARPFHHESAFIRFRPYGAHGRLDGKNRLPENALAGV